MYKVYRCLTDKKLFIPKDLDKHQGHKVGYGVDESILETVKVAHWMLTKKLEKRAHYQL